MRNGTRKPNDGNVFAVLHRTGGGWHGVIARTAVSRRGGQGSDLSLLATREFPRDATGRIDAWLDEFSALEVICVLPASAVICRTCSLPDAPIEQLHAALRLQAEAHLFGIAPPHRLGMAVLESAPGETTRSGIILAWPESAKVSLPPTNRPIRFAPDVAALAAIVDGQRPAQPLIWLDRESGSMSLAVSHASGVAFRAVREDAEDDETWRSSIGRVLAETSLNVGHTEAFVRSAVQSVQQQATAVESGQSTLLLPSSLMEEAASRIDGAGRDVEWWSRYGIAAGAALLRTGPLAALSQLEEAPPAEAPSRLRDAIAAMAKPRTARNLAIACVLALMFGPLATNWLRLTFLQLRHPDLHAQLEQVNQVRNQLAMYRQLQQDASPMTKILADIACNTPEGIELEMIRLQIGRTFTVRGRALQHHDMSATELVVLMQQYLRDSGIFNEITLNWGDSDAYGNYDFELSARLLNPYRQHRYPDDLDFGTRTLAQRLYGPDAGTGITGGAGQRLAAGSRVEPGRVRVDPLQVPEREPGAPVGELPDPDGHADRGELDAGRQDPQGDHLGDAGGDRPRPRSARPSPGSGAFGDAGTRDDARGQGGVAPSQDIPDPITEAEIAAMSDGQVWETLVRVSQARNIARRRNDKELEQRLQREFDWLMERRRGER